MDPRVTGNEETDPPPEIVGSVPNKTQRSRSSEKEQELSEQTFWHEKSSFFGKELPFNSLDSQNPGLITAKESGWWTTKGFQHFL